MQEQDLTDSLDGLSRQVRDWMRMRPDAVALTHGHFILARFG